MTVLNRKIPSKGQPIAYENGLPTAEYYRFLLQLAIDLPTGTIIALNDPELLALSGLVSAADKLPYFTGSGTAALTDITATARTVLDDATTSDMRTTLGVAIGSNVQAFDSTLSSLAAYNTNGLLTQTAADTFAGRTITGTANKITVTDGNGVAGNPTLNVGSDVYIVGGTDVAVADGGTGSSTASGARTNLGFADGTYSATFTDVANLDGDPTSTDCQYLRVGNTVTVSGKVTVDCTANTTLTQLGISLPIASNFANDYECAGTANCPTVVGMSAAIVADTTNDRAEMKWTSNNTASQDMFFTFTYLVI